MSRPKGSKNKSSVAPVTSAPADQISQAEQEVEALNSEISQLTEQITEQKKQLISKKRAEKILIKKLTILKNIRAEQEAKAAAEAKKVQAEKLLADILASGKSVDDIIDRLK